MDARLRVRLLGVPEAGLDGQRVAALKFRKTQAFLYLLAAQRAPLGGPQPCALLTGLLSGDLPDVAARANLQRAFLSCVIMKATCCGDGTPMSTVTMPQLIRTGALVRSDFVNASSTLSTRRPSVTVNEGCRRSRPTCR